MPEQGNTWERLASLPLRIEGYAFEPLQALVSSEFERKSTVIHIVGAGQEGVGEDVTYDAVDHEILQAAGPRLSLQGDWTIGSFSEHLATLDLFPREPQREVSRRYRVWAYESAALDLALRQAGTTLHEALGRTAKPVRRRPRRTTCSRSSAPWTPPACLRHLSHQAGAPALMTPEVIATLADHAQGNLRSLMIMADELLAAAAERQAERIDEALLFEACALAPQPKAVTGKRR